MKRHLTLLRQYQAALQKHLQKGTNSRALEAHRLGHRAVALGLETLQLARIHEHAVVALKLSENKESRAGSQFFFNEAITPIVETHAAARQSKIHLRKLNEQLGRRTSQLATANRQLQRGIIKRESVEAALKKSGQHYSMLLKESLHIQHGLRKMAQKLLIAQEDERMNVSRELRDHVAQTLLGINVRLISLKRDAKINSKDLKGEIASTQRLVRKSATSVRRVTREFRNA